MKTIPKLLISVVMLLLVRGSFAQDVIASDKLKFVKNQYLEINKNLSSYKKIIEQDTIETTEGNVITAYINDSKIQKITAIYYGEIGKEVNEYYFSNNQLIFYYSDNINYKIPINIDPNISIKSADEDRFYFNNNSIIKYINTKGKAVSEEALNAMAVKILKETKRLRSLIR